MLFKIKWIGLDAIRCKKESCEDPFKIMTTLIAIVENDNKPDFDLKP